MIPVGFHASHEQYPPSLLLKFACEADAAGFTLAMCSDHFHPWSEREGQSGFAWSWLGAALQVTDMTFGVVCAPGQRYHPAIIAQASATLAEMYPGRFWMALGSGEALNETITGDEWPPKPGRNQRLKEAADVIRALWRGETVSHRGAFKVENAKLYTRPEEPPLMFGAALTVETATWMGSWTDGLITAGSDFSSLAKIVQAYRGGGGKENSVMLQAAVCIGDTDSDALALAHHQWRHAALDGESIANVSTPKEFDAAVAEVRPEELRGNVFLATDSKAIEQIALDAEDAGFDRVYIHPICHDVPSFIQAMQE